VGAYVAAARCLVVASGAWWHGFEVGWLVDGGCGEKEVTWQRFSHSYHIWNVVGSVGGIYFPWLPSK
jgi:hypothetical protein